MATQLKIGDLVRLKSGGPTMVVATVIDKDNIYCQWFAGKKQEAASFNAEILVRVEEEK